MEKFITVVIPNYNGADFLVEAVSSALEQDFTNTEIIVVDDGSTDASMALLDDFGDRIRVIHTRNQGASAARNVGMLAAEGELIAFLDGDDIWLKSKLRLQVAKMELEGADLVYCHGQEFGDKHGSSTKHLALYSGDCYPAFKQNPGKAIIDMGPSTVLFKKSLLSLSGIFDTTFTGPAEDWDFFRRYCRLAKVAYCDEVLAMHRNHSSNVSNRSRNEYYLGNKRALLKMFAEDFEIGVAERRLIWTKFNFMFAKSFAKSGDIKSGVACLLRIVLPINL